MAIHPDYAIVPQYAVLGSRRRPGRHLAAVRFVVAHDTGNPGASAAAHARWYRNDPNPAQPASAHLFVDDVAIVETVPAMTAAAEHAPHVRNSVPLDNQLYGIDANEGAIGVEYCFGGSINADEAYRRYVWILAALCDRFRLDPTRDIVSHKLLDPARRSDPDDGLGRSGRSYEGLLADVRRVYASSGGEPSMVGAHAIAPGTYHTSVHLVLRDSPRRSAANLEVLPPGTPVEVETIVEGEAVNGNSDWCAVDRGFLWSGGLRA